MRASAFYLAASVVSLSLLMWIVFEKGVREADVFYGGAGLDLLKLFVVALIYVCILAVFAYLELKERFK